MSLLPYKSSGWNTHREFKLREIDFPLFDKGCVDHLVVTRSYIGPRENYVPIELSTVDAIYDGVAASITGTASTDQVAYASAKKLLTGDPVVLAVTTGLAGLSAGTYYLIRIDDSTFKLATTRANAIAGTAVDITSDGTGTLAPPAAYLVSQSALKDAQADQVAYERDFATVPASWSDPESFPYSFPGYDAGSVGSGKAINGITASGSNSIFTLSVSGDAVAGDSVNITVSYTRNGTAQSAAFTAAAVATTNTSQVTVARQLPGSGAFSSVSGTATKLQAGAAASRNLTPDGRVLYEYALGAAPVATPIFSPVDATGEETKLLTATTSPTASAYRGYVLAGTEICVESTSKRYLGNIYVRGSRLLPAK